MTNDTNPGLAGRKQEDKRMSRQDRHPGRRTRSSGGGNGRIALILAVLGLVLIVVFIIPRGQTRSAEPLPRATLATSDPINTTDPTSGKPVALGLSSVYKGYTIGHCCAQSKTDWEVLSVERKEAYIRGFLR